MSKKAIMALLSLLLVFTLILSGCTPAAKPSTPPAETPAEEPTPDEPQVEEPPVATEENLEQLIIASSTDPSGDFATPIWQNNATDNLVNSLLNGYATYEVAPTAELVLNNTAVEEQVITDNEDGSRTYQFTIRDGLTYNDGSPITAKDYVASVLLWSSKQIADFDGKPTAGLKLVGFEDFRFGGSKIFEGVHLLDDMVFSLTIDEAYVPYFYEVANVAVGPEPLSFWLGEGEADVADDGEGAYFTGPFADISDDIEGEDFARIKDYVLAQRTVIPRVTSGPYEAVDFNQSTKTTIITINDKYLGNFEGQKPSIQDLVFKKSQDATQFDELRTGVIDLLSELGGGDEINAGMDLIEETEDKFDFVTYPRAGYGRLMFVCDFGPTQYVEVRHAIAHLLDRNDFAAAFTGGYGSVVNGPYGEGQWFYKESKAELDSRLNHYNYDFDTAVALLEQAGFTLDADGNEYAGTGVRHRLMEDGSLMPLELYWLSTEDNPVTELLTVKLQESEDVAAAGIVIHRDEVDFPVLLNWLYRDVSEGEEYGVPKYNMMNLGSNFPFGFTHDYEFTTDPELIADGANNNYIVDEELYQLSIAYSLADPSDREEFRSKWVDFIVKWNELLPDVPLYSNEYHSFFNAKLKNFQPDSNVGLGVSLLYATLE